MVCNCNNWRRWVVLAALAAFTFGMARTASAQGVYFTPESVLKDFFAASDHVTYVTVETAASAQTLTRQLGYLPSKKSYVVYVATTKKRIDGYAVIDEQLGQHLPITLATKISAQGAVERTEVMVYRERYGEEIRNERFRAQFVGKNVDDAIRPGDDIVAISGATISSSSVALAVKRAAALVRLATVEATARAEAGAP